MAVNIGFENGEPNRLDDLIFQHFHIEIGPISKQNDESLPIIRIFGRTAEGLSVCCRVRNFSPAIHVGLPLDFETEHCEALRVALNEKVKSKITKITGVTADFVSKVELTVLRRPSQNVSDKEVKVAKLIMSSYRYFPDILKLIDLCDIEIPGLEKFSIQNISTLDDSLSVMFRKDFNIIAFSWIELAAGTYSLVSDLPKVVARESSCQLEIIVNANHIVSHCPTGEWNRVVKFTIVSFDIECLPRPGVFVDAKLDPVLQISSIAIRYLESEPFIKRLFTLNDCSTIEGVTVTSHSDEKDMLETWAKFIHDLDPDMLIGHNIINFDLRYLLRRSKVLNSETFCKTLGRIGDTMSTWLPSTDRNRFSDRQEFTVDIPGRMLFDVYLAVASEPAYSRPCYSLEEISFEITRERKKDVHYTKIASLHFGDKESRRALGEYCLQDSMLPIKILMHSGLIATFLTRTRQAGLQFNRYTCSGHNVKESFSSTLQQIKSILQEQDLNCKDSKVANLTRDNESEKMEPVGNKSDNLPKLYVSNKRRLGMTRIKLPIDQTPSRDADENSHEAGPSARFKVPRRIGQQMNK